MSIAEPVEQATVAGGVAADDDTWRPPAAPPPRRFSRGWWASLVLVPTLRGVLLALALVGVALALPAPVGFWAAAGVLGTGLLVDGVAAVAPWRVGVARSHERVVVLGGELELEWEVANPRSRALSVSLADELVPSLRAGDRRAVVQVRGDGIARAGTTLRPSRRGRFLPSGVTVRVAGPLGLAARQHRRALVTEISVHPAFPSRDRIAARLERSRELDVGLRSTRGRGAGTDFDSLREYVVDDDVRHIDWAATARVGSPIVRTYHEERNQRVLVLLDLGRTMAGLVAGVPRLDHAMDAVLGLATVAGRLGDRTGLVAFGADVRRVVPPEGGTAQVGVLSEAMADLDAELAEAGYREAFGHALTRFRRRAMLVVVTDLHAEAIEDTLLPALPLLLRTHVVVVASVRDPVVATWVGEVPDEVDDVYRAAAASAAVASRDVAAARLRSLGAIVVDAPPGDVAALLADAYLEIKATGRL